LPAGRTNHVVRGRGRERDPRRFPYRFLPALQLLSDLLRAAPGKVRVGVGVVADCVYRRHFGGEAGFAPDVVSWHEESRPYPLAVQDLQQLLRVWVARSVVEGQRDHTLLGAGVPEDRAVEPGTRREPLVHHQPTGGHPDPRRRQRGDGAERLAGGGTGSCKGCASSGKADNHRPDSCARVSH
jgi:hypothetical protein